MEDPYTLKVIDNKKLSLFNYLFSLSMIVLWEWLILSNDEEISLAEDFNFRFRYILESKILFSASVSLSYSQIWICSTFDCFSSLKIIFDKLMVVVTIPQKATKIGFNLFLIKYLFSNSFDFFWKYTWYTWDFLQALKSSKVIKIHQFPLIFSFFSV